MLSKYAHFILLKRPFTTKIVAETFVKEVVRLHGFPKTIVSDRDPVFLSNFWKEMFRLQGTKLNMSTSYHPQTDGQTEVVNRCLEIYLRCFTSEQPRNWSFWIPWAEFWYNTSYHSSIKTTPFEAVYGRPPPALIHYQKGETMVESIAQALVDRDEALRQLKLNLQKAQNSMKQNSDKHRRKVDLSVGDWVYVKLRPHRQNSVTKRIYSKLTARYYGPFQIEARIGEVAYRLILPTTSRVHPVFHVSQLKRAIGDLPVEKDLPPEWELDVSPRVEPEAVLSSQVVTKQGKRFEEWLIRWKNRPIEDATWEKAINIKNQFPTFCLEDKADSAGEGIDRGDSSAHEGLLAQTKTKPKTLQVYSRRPKRN